jgi:aldose 1-epimerase
MKTTFTLTKDSFGRFERYTIEHPDQQLRMQFVPERGACLLSLVFAGHEVLDGYQTPEELDFNNWGKSGLLYPFPNRLKDGRFEWLRNTYQFPRNDEAHHNALHGFGMQRPLEVVKTDLQPAFARIRMEHRYDGAYAYYPWPFTLAVTYELRLPGQFQITMSLRNEADVVIPVGLGWHPYFQLAATAAEHELELPKVDLVGIDPRMIPTGKRYAYDEFAIRRKIGATVLDNCFAISTKDKKVRAGLGGERGKLSYWQETGAGKFNFLQVFTPPYGTSVALEPMTCNVDAFNNGEGLATLASGELLEARAGVAYL